MSTAQAAGGSTNQGGYTSRGADIIQVLGPDGSIVDKEREPSLTDEVLHDLYRAMVRARVADEAATSLWEDKRIPFHSACRGEEAALVGSAWALRAQDQMFLSHRSLGAALLRGLSTQAYADHVFGNVDDPTKGRQMPDHYSGRAAGIASVGSLLGTQIVHALGFAWAAKLRKDPIAVLASFGETAIDSGGFHDAMNFAGVFRPPVVFLCRNGSGTALEDVGAAYAVDSIRCDAADLFAMIDVTKHAVAKALAGDGATFIEAVSTGDVDPIARVRAYIASRMRWTDEDDEAVWTELKGEVTAAFESAAKKAAPPLSSMFDDVFAQRPERLEEQVLELERGPRYPRRGTDG